MAQEENTLGGNGHVAIHDWEPVDQNGYHKNSDEIEHDIEETRHSMDVILDTLSGRVNPRAYYDRILNYFQKPENKQKITDSLKTVGEKVSGSFQRNPLPVIMISSGVTWLLWESQKPKSTPNRDYDYSGMNYREGYKNDPGEGAHTKQDQLRDVADKSKQKFDSAKEAFGQKSEEFRAGFDKMKGRSSQMREQAMDSVHHTADSVRDNASRVDHTVRDSASRVNQTVHDNPLLAGFVAAFAGLVTGLLIPESRTEKNTMGPAASDTINKVKEKGEEYLEKGKNVADETVATAKEKAKEEGLTPENITQEARSPSSEPVSEPPKLKEEDRIGDTLIIEGDITRQSPDDLSK